VASERHIISFFTELTFSAHCHIIADVASITVATSCREGADLYFICGPAASWVVQSKIVSRIRRLYQRDKQGEVGEGSHGYGGRGRIMM